MRRIISILLLIISGYGSGYTQTIKNTKVFVVDIKDEINPKTWRIVEKSLKKADKDSADYIIIDMNTYGGMVIYADSLRTMLLNYPKPVWAFVNNNAASAGALIAIACDKIFMREGANIGAATVVNQTGEAMPDKYQSYMRSMMRSTAEAKGKKRTTTPEGDTITTWVRDPKIAEAMVDESLRVEGIIDSGQVITFTPGEAMKYGFCDGIASSVPDILKKEGIENYSISVYEPTYTDYIIGFFMNPIVRGLLIMIIVGGIYFELQTPGIGFPLLAAITACLLYFVPSYIEGLASNWEIILLFTGILLLLIEIFAIPGFGITGSVGIVCIIISLACSTVGFFSLRFIEQTLSAIINSLLLVVSTALVALIGSMWLGKRLISSPARPFALHASQLPEEGYVGVDLSLKEQIGKTGFAFSDLRPSGKVIIEDEIYDAVSALNDYIPAGTPIIVLKYQTGQLYVTVKVH